MFVISIWSLIYVLFLMFSFLLFFLGILLLNFSLGMYITWEIFSWGSSSINMIFLMDWISFLFLSFVLFISGSVFYYSGEYMEGEKSFSRFIFLLAMFVGSMGLLIFSPNLISMLLGWDGLGLVSYCLVIYYQNFKSLNSGTLTVLSNRVGDVFILLGIVWMMNYGDWSLVAWLGDSASMVLVSFLIVLASLTKSAQIPFSAWLPAAMAAPTPVSSLVHSSTLVTAGVYLVIRLGWVYDFWLNEMLMVLSLLTMLMSGVGACMEFDLKKIIALSTLSQLGLMMYSLSLGMVKMAFFHLLMHALFKALLFMSAGSVIHSYKGWQDIRMMGNMMVSLPYMSSCFVVSNLALSGLPFLAGFYSKDLILELSLMGELNIISLFLLFFATGLTVMYTFRLIYYVTRREYVMSGSAGMSDGIGVMLKSTLGLVFFSIFFGALISWVMMDLCVMVLPSMLKNLTSLVCFLGAVAGYLMSQSSYMFSCLKFSFLVWVGGSMWFLPYVSSQPFVGKPLMNSMILMNYGDLGWLELFGGQGMSVYLMSISNILRNMGMLGFKVFILGLWIMVVFFMFF
uniref:NADH dehydrogenase subunit 5 n=1 Tax=Calantica studeri TaxID=2977347 RepID=UPI0021CC611A|nr:NADH dehydrogenase subunit 5 [Calantica studeri]UWM12863.1 NADH dehydrogenase subunit 5 [Calantica studeri]